MTRNKNRDANESEIRIGGEFWNGIWNREGDGDNNGIRDGRNGDGNWNED